MWDNICSAEATGLAAVMTAMHGACLGTDRRAAMTLVFQFARSAWHRVDSTYDPCVAAPVADVAKQESHLSRRWTMPNHDEHSSISFSAPAFSLRNC